MKDNFSRQSDEYARFRPAYPTSLYEFLLSLVREKTLAWDCGTGNGQVAAQLAPHFSSVIATDLSERQLKNSLPARNIQYRVERAERSSLRDGEADLITIGQALHWFDLNDFYEEARRTLKPRGLIAAFGYSLCRVDGPVDRVIHRFYHDVVGSHWDEERRHVESEYKHLPFPFKETQHPPFECVLDWNLDHFCGYLGTWSAVQHYVETHNRSPLDHIVDELRASWDDGEVKKVRFPVFMRAGTA